MRSRSLRADSPPRDPRILAAVLLAGDAGFRRNEILAAKQIGVNYRTGMIQVSENVYFKGKGTVIEDTPKGGKSGWIPCTPRLLAALRACRHLRGKYVLYTDDGKQVTPKILRRWVMRAEAAAGLPQTGRLHIFRHTYASHLAMAGAPAKAIQELCRHSSLDITQRYLHTSAPARSARPLRCS